MKGGGRRLISESPQKRVPGERDTNSKPIKEKRRMEGKLKTLSGTSEESGRTPEIREASARCISVTFENVLLRCRRFQILDQIIGLLQSFIFQVVDHLVLVYVEALMKREKGGPSYASGGRGSWGVDRVNDEISAGFNSQHPFWNSDGGWPRINSRYLRRASPPLVKYETAVFFYLPIPVAESKPLYRLWF